MDESKRVDTTSGWLDLLRPPAAGEDARAWRLRMYPAGVFFVFLALFVYVVSGAAGVEVTLGGDYSAFYAAGRIVLEGNFENLYDLETQTAAQADLAASQTAGVLYFAYPPFVAYLFAPLALIGFIGSFVAYTTILLASFLVALRVGWSRTSVLNNRFFLVAMLALAFSPSYRSIIGSMTTMIYFLLFVAVMREMEDDESHPARLTLILTLALIKPQLGLPLVGLVIWQRQADYVRAGIGAVASFWVLNAVVAGPFWVTDWINVALEFQDRPNVGETSISIAWVGVLAFFFGGDALVPTVIGYGLSLATIGILLYAWRPSSPLSVRGRFSLLAAGALLLSPHAIFYDAGLLVIPFLCWLDEGRVRLWGLALIAAVSWAEPLGWAPGTYPIFHFVVAVFAVELWRFWRIDRAGRFVQAPALAESRRVATQG